jgi:hypothetical protein
VTGAEDGSALDAETTDPHPLSWLRIDLGSASLQAAGLHLVSRDPGWVTSRCCRRAA